MVLVRGKFERDEESSRLLVSEITLLDVVRDRAVREVQIRLAGGRGTDRDAMRRLASVFERYPGDRRVSFVVEVNGRAPGVARAHGHGPPDPAERPLRARRRGDLRGRDGRYSSEMGLEAMGRSLGQRAAICAAGKPEGRRAQAR